MIFDVMLCNTYNLQILRNLHHWPSELPELFVVTAGLKCKAKGLKWAVIQYVLHRLVGWLV